MRNVRVKVEKYSGGYAASMFEDDDLCLITAEAGTLDGVIALFLEEYKELRNDGSGFPECNFEFMYDAACYLELCTRALSLAGISRITGINQTLLGHYLHGRRKPKKKTAERIRSGIKDFNDRLTAVGLF